MDLRYFDVDIACAADGLLRADILPVGEFADVAAPAAMDSVGDGEMTSPLIRGLVKRGPASSHCCPTQPPKQEQPPPRP